MIFSVQVCFDHHMRPSVKFPTWGVMLALTECRFGILRWGCYIYSQMLANRFGESGGDSYFAAVERSAWARVIAAGLTGVRVVSECFSTEEKLGTGGRWPELAL